jgi:hypothetical protein
VFTTMPPILPSASNGESASGATAASAPETASGAQQ